MIDVKMWWCLCDYSGAYILVKVTIVKVNTTVPNMATVGTLPDNRNKKVMLHLLIA